MIVFVEIVDYECVIACQYCAVQTLNPFTTKFRSNFIGEAGPRQKKAVKRVVSYKQTMIECGMTVLVYYEVNECQFSEIVEKCQSSLYIQYAEVILFDCK